MKQIDWFSFYPKAIVLKTITLASCTTSLFYVNLFQRTLSFGCSLVKNSLSALASSVARLIRPLAMTRLKQTSFFVHLAYRVRSRKRMQSYSFFRHEPNVSREKFIKRARF